MQYAPIYMQCSINQQITHRTLVLHTPKIAPICDVVAVVYDAVHAVVYRVYAIHQINVKCAINKGIAPP